MARTRRGCLPGVLGLALLLGVLLVGTWYLVPGDLHFGRAGGVGARAASTEPASAATGSPAASAPTATAPAAAGGSGAGRAWMTYVVPDDILHAELKKSFPIRQNVFDLVKLRLDEPEFIPDADGSFLRLRLAIEVRVVEGDLRFPGTAEVRTRLAYDRPTRRVLLRDAQLVALQFAGDHANRAGALQPVLAAALAAEMEGYPVVQLEAEGVWWLKSGAGFVREIYVHQGRVAVAFGP